MVDPPLLDEWHEQRTRARRDTHVRIEILNRALVGARVNRARGPDDADVSPGARAHRGARARFDDAKHGDRQLLSQRRKRVRRRGVARDDDRFDVLGAQELRYLAAVSANGVGALGSVWDTRGVAEIDDALIRQLPHDLADDG